MADPDLKARIQRLMDEHEIPHGVDTDQLLQRTAAAQAENDRLKHLLWECHCAASDGVPVPFERWLIDDGPDGMPADVRELRGAYDTASDREYTLSKVPAAMITRIQAAADIVDADAVSRTSGTLLKMAVVLAIEFAGASDENCNDEETP